MMRLGVTLQEGYLRIRSCKAAGYVGCEVLQQV